jgi:hypothetical protein
MLEDALNGRGEVGKNNHGPHIAAITLGHEGAAWCAAEVTDALHRSASKLGYVMPIRHDWKVGSPRRGARALVRACARVGAWVDAPPPGNQAMGYVFGIKRSGDRWSGHAGMIVEHISGLVCRTVEGNVGAFPAVVRVMTRDFSREDPCWMCPSMFACLWAG